MQHSADCGSLADPQLALDMAEAGVLTDIGASPWADAAGKVWRDQAGQGMDLVGHIENATGQRVTTAGSLFEPAGTGGGRRSRRGPASP